MSNERAVWDKIDSLIDIVHTTDKSVALLAQTVRTERDSRLAAEEMAAKDNKVRDDKIDLLVKSRVRDASAAGAVGMILGAAVGELRSVLPLLAKLFGVAGLVFAVALLSGCAPDSALYGAHAHWLEAKRPVSLYAADDTSPECGDAADDTSPECGDAVDEALSFWRVSPEEVGWVL